MDFNTKILHAKWAFHAVARGDDGPRSPDDDTGILTAMRATPAFLRAPSDSRHPFLGRKKVNVYDARHPATRWSAPHVNNLARWLGPDAHVNRAVRLVEVEAVERGIFHDPAREVTAFDAGDQEVGREAESPTYGSPRAVNLVARVLITGRVDAARDVPSQPRGCEGVREFEPPELLHNWVEDHSAERTHRGEGGILAGHVVEGLPFSAPSCEAAPRLSALDEIAVPEMFAASFVNVHRVPR